LRLRDFLEPELPDPIVIARAQELGTILLSLNGDFADIVTYPPARYGESSRSKFTTTPRSYR
jgi:hypothetical protein